ncbi:hypothetical protein [Niveibacterium sp. SC-1]
MNPNANSPLEYLAAFALTFAAGMLSAAAVSTTIKRETVIAATKTQA